MNEGKNRIFIPALLGATFLVVTLNVWLAFLSIKSLEESQAWLDHTYQAIAQIESLVNVSQQTEGAARDYQVTGEQLDLDTYRNKRDQLPNLLEQLHQTVVDNNSQRARVEYMRQLIVQRRLQLEDSILLSKAGKNAEAQDLVFGASNRWVNVALRKSADDMETEERRLLDDRTIKVSKDAQRARLAILFASFLDLVLILLMFRYFARERGLRVEAELAGIRLEAAKAETEKKAEEISELNATLEQRVQQRTAELETINRELEAFSYSVSHDLRAPLRTIDGFSLALEEDYSSVVDEMGKDYIHRVRTGVQRMGMLIDALLQLSRITRAELVRESFNISAVAESVAGVLKEQNPERDLRFLIEPDLRTSGDPSLVRVALENLLGNAVKFSSKKPFSAVEFGFDSKQKAWFVKDNGAGFDMHYAGKLFGAFNRLHGDKDFKGSGIGLATVARVVRRHQGKIWAEAQEGHGATFWFTLG